MISLFVLVLMNSIYCEHSNYRNSIEGELQMTIQKVSALDSKHMLVKRFKDYYATPISLL